jgi:hypothetical protein
MMMMMRMVLIMIVLVEVVMLKGVAWLLVRPVVVR